MAKYRVDTDGGSYIVETEDAPPIPGMDKLGALPGPASPPNAILRDTGAGPQRPGESRLDYLRRNVGATPKAQAQMQEVESDREAGGQVVRGIRDVATAPTGERKAKGASQAIRGTMHLGRGAVPAVAPVAPVATVLGLGVGMGAQAVTEKGLEIAGVPEGYRELAGDVVGVVAGGKAAKARAAARPRYEGGSKPKGSIANAVGIATDAVRMAVNPTPARAVSLGARIARAIDRMKGSQPETSAPVVDPYETATYDPWAKPRPPAQPAPPPEPPPARASVPTPPPPAEAPLPKQGEYAPGDYYAPKPAGTPGQEYAKAQGIDYDSLPAADRAVLEHIAKAQQNASAQPPPRPVAPVQPAEAAPAPVERGKTIAELMQEELAAKRAAAPPEAAPVEAPEMIGAHTPKVAPAPKNPPLRPPMRTAETPPSPRQEVIQPQTPAVPAAVESPAPAPPAPPAAPLNPVEIGRRIMRSMGMEDVAPKDALQTFQNLQELSARTGQPIEALYQKYTGEPLTGAAEPPAPKPITPKQGEAAMFRSKEATAEVNPNLDPNETRTFTAASGETKSKALRAEEKKAFNADAKAKRFAEAFHAEGVTAEDVANMTAADAKVMTDGLIAKGLLKKGEMPPSSSLPRLIAHLKDLEKQAKKAATEAPKPAELPVRAPQSYNEYAAMPPEELEAHLAGKSTYTPAPEPTPAPAAASPKSTARQIPSIGETGREVYQNWKRLVEGPQPPRATIEGFVPGVGRFGMRSGKVQFLESRHMGRGRGYVSMTRDATKAEIQELHEAISRGQFQVEQRTIRGALGVREHADAGALEKVLHQATGRPLAEFLATDEGKAWAKRTNYREPTSK